MNTETAEKLYEAFYMKVFSYVMTLAGNQDEAMEITQETFFRAISTDKTFRGDSDSYTWLCAIAKNIFIDEKRRESKLLKIRRKTSRIQRRTWNQNLLIRNHRSGSTVSFILWMNLIKRCSSSEYLENCHLIR